jgi:hypothetical protein
MSSLESQLPPPFKEALALLRQRRDPDARIDAVDSNFAYIWINNLAKNTSGEARGGWIRLPLAFPHANPHGLVTRDALMRGNGSTVADGHNPGHDMCKPVSSMGGAHYYSWTWAGAPPLNSPEDIIGVTQWYERRIRNG